MKSAAQWIRELHANSGQVFKDFPQLASVGESDVLAIQEDARADWKRAFEHTRDKQQGSDLCSKCGLDLRDDIHIRSPLQDLKSTREMYGKYYA